MIEVIYLKNAAIICDVAVKKDPAAIYCERFVI